MGAPGWTGPAPAERLAFARLLVDLPDGPPVDLRMRNRLAAAGVLLEPRDAILRPERWDDPDAGPTAALAIAVLVAASAWSR